MNEWEIQVMYMLIMSGGLIAFFAIGEMCLNAYWRIRFWLENRK